MAVWIREGERAEGPNVVQCAERVATSVGRRRGGQALQRIATNCTYLGSAKLDAA